MYYILNHADTFFAFATEACLYHAEKLRNTFEIDSFSKQYSSILTRYCC